MRTFAAAALMLALSGAAAGAQNATDPGPTLTVRGQGIAEVAPDHAKLTVEAVTRGKSLEEATAAHRDRAERAVNALNGMKNDGVTIERSSFNLNEIRTPPAPAGMPRREDVSYQAATTFELKVARLDRVDAAITAIAMTGLFEVRNLRFAIEDRNPGLKVAYAKAVEDARDRATAYAQAAGVQLREIWRIDDTDMRGPREFAVAAAPMMRSVKVIPPEQLTLNASVTITWRIGGKP